MKTHSNIFAWKIPWIEEPVRLQFIGLQTDRLEQACAHSRIILFLEQGQ